MRGSHRRIVQALDRDETDQIDWLVEGLAEAFIHHAAVEEAGLFNQLTAAGEAVQEVERLVAEHRQIAGGLTSGTSPEALRQLLEKLVLHAEIEDTDLFPFAMQMLPDDRWGEVEAIHQILLTA
jgi:hemerythrin-like domain-containing protein